MYSLIFAIFKWSTCTTWEGVSFTKKIKETTKEAIPKNTTKEMAGKCFPCD